MAKGKLEVKAERRCARCKTLSRAMLKNRERHRSDDAVKRGYELRCEKIALCIAAFRVAALWCTKAVFALFLRKYCRIHKNYRPEIYYFGIILGN